jgi:putative zinc finger/helix-turn-helix YgiT family protein
MSSIKSGETRTRPYPWHCVTCGTRTVVPTVMDHVAKVKHDGTIYELQLHNIEVPQCPTCSETYPTAAVDDRVSDALRARLRLLTPAQIQDEMSRLGLTEQQLSERLGVTVESVSRWRDGTLIQSRAMDNLLRIYFAVPEARRVLLEASQNPQLGAVGVD